MKTNNPILITTAILTASLSCLPSLQARTRGGTYSAANGHASGTFNQSVARQQGIGSRSTGWTNSQGGQGSHNVNNTWNSSSASGTHSSSTAYANGMNSSSQGTFSQTSPENYSYNGTHTGVNGNVTDVSKNASVQNGALNVNSAYTGANGKTADVSKTATVNPNGTVSVDSTYTGANGKTVTSDQTYAKSANGYTGSGTITGPNGKQATDNDSVSYSRNADGSYTRSQSEWATGPNGQTINGGNSETWTDVEE